MDEIRITDLEIYGHHGVLKEENVLGQKFLVSLVLRLDTKKAGISDNIDDSIDYADVSNVVRTVMEKTNYNLIEAAAENIASTVLKRYSIVKSLTVEVKKPWAPISIPLETVSVKIDRGWHEVYLSLGANLGEREDNIQSALEILKEDEKIDVLKVADIIETKPYGVTDQPDFLNTCVCIKTLYSPHEMLDKIHETEKEKKRLRIKHWGPRTLDIDIIYYDDLVLQGEDLIIPHADMHNREFVLKPLAQIAPWVKHPVLGKTTLELLNMVEDDR
ncbi:MAG: 2-amino-4-hydroxy-6-hydroxymethyldihydropteridine diphosphokinase [Eubacterium sp.]|nr:2-amino-4-hydroxy-6-hydroxymethyldihydropteridine diphosphokinase [Eubacterium sp.]